MIFPGNNGSRFFIATVLRAGVILAALFSAQASAHAAVDGSNPYEIGSRLELFLDDFLVEQMSGAADRRLHQPVPREIVLELEKPWEGSFAYFTSIQDKEKVRLYYSARPPRGEREDEAACVAESPDGVHFFRPELDLYDYEEFEETNMVLRRAGAGHHFTPFIDANPAASPEQRYKGLGNYRGLRGFVSPDGLNWESLEEARLPSGHSDSQNVAFWDPLRRKYVAYARQWVEIDGNRVRHIRRAESEDFTSWTGTGLIEFADDRVEQMYTSGIQPYFRAPHIYIGLANRRARRATHDTVLMSSRDGLLFERWQEAFLSGDTDARNWTDRNHYIAWGMVQLSPEEISLYWTEHNRYPTKRVRRGTIRTDGFVSVYAGAEGGEIITRPMLFSGDRLLVNFATSSAGTMRFELQDEDGQPIPGFTLDESETHTGNYIERVISWNGGACLEALRGRPVRLRVELNDSHLYSIRFLSRAELRKRLENALDEAAGVLEQEPERFVLVSRKQLQDDIRQFRTLFDDGEEDQRVIEAHDQSAVSLATYRQKLHAGKRARQLIEAAGALEEGEPGFGRAYRIPVTLAADRLEMALERETGSIEEVEKLVKMLEGAIENLEQAAHARARAGQLIVSADEVAEARAEGFGLLYRERINSLAATLRKMIADEHATLGGIKRAIDNLAGALVSFGETESFSPVNPREITGRVVSLSLGGEDEWERGQRVNLAPDGEALVPSIRPELFFPVVYPSRSPSALARFPAGEHLQTQSMTVEARVRFADLRGSIPVLRLGGTRRRHRDAPTIHLDDLFQRSAWLLRTEGKTLQFTLGGPDAEERITVSSDEQALVKGAEHHVAASYDGRELRLYLDGELVGSKEHSRRINYDNTWWLFAGGPGGGGRGAPVVRDPFIGNLRDLRVWNQARSGPEIRAHMNRLLNGDEEGLGGYWLAGRKAGSEDTVFDLTEHENHGMIHKALWESGSGYRIADPLGFPGIAEVSRSSIRWHAEGEDAGSEITILVGLSESAERLPQEWRRAENGGSIPFITAGQDMRGRYLWLKTVMNSSIPSTLLRLYRVEMEIE